MADILPFPRRQVDIITQLDASVTCIRRLRAASRMPSDKMRTEALGARLDIAGFREAMCGALTSTAVTSGRSAEIECAWGRLEDLLDQVATCSSYFYDESHSGESYAMRGQLRATCRSTLTELDCLRSLLLPELRHKLTLVTRNVNDVAGSHGRGPSGRSWTHSNLYSSPC